MNKKKLKDTFEWKSYVKNNGLHVKVSKRLHNDFYSIAVGPKFTHFVKKKNVAFFILSELIWWTSYQKASLFLGEISKFWPQCIVHKIWWESWPPSATFSGHFNTNSVSRKISKNILLPTILWLNLDLDRWFWHIVRLMRFRKRKEIMVSKDSTKNIQSSI